MNVTKSTSSHGFCAAGASKRASNETKCSAGADGLEDVCWKSGCWNCVWSAYAEKKAMASSNWTL